MNTTIEEAASFKAHVERDIARSIAAMTANTGVRVIGIRCEFDQKHNPPTVKAVRLEVDL